MTRTIDMSRGLNRDFAFLRARLTPEIRERMASELARVNAERVAQNAPEAVAARTAEKIAHLREGLALYGADDPDYAESTREKIARLEETLTEWYGHPETSVSPETLAELIAQDTRYGLVAAANR